MRYAVYQIQVDPLDKASMDAKAEAMIRGDASLGLSGGFYSKVAEIEAADLEDVFDIGNIGPAECITRIGRMHSISVGDIIEDADGVRHVVANFGFNQIG
jgi:hypothetical protein